MARYINIDEIPPKILDGKVVNEELDLPNNNVTVKNIVEMYIDEDVAPIVHAHWFPVTEPDDKGRVQYGCSHCRAFASFTYDRDQRFCGACGAKMD